MNRRPADTRFFWLSTLVLLLAAAMRLIMLRDIPPGLAQDEVLNADIVQYILQGEHALFFRHGFGHEPLYHYLAVPFQVLLGDNIMAIRLPSVFLSLIMIALTMRWGKRDFGTVAALIAGCGLATSWWAIVFARIGIRPVLETVLLVAAVWSWPRRPWLAGILLGLIIYSYTAGRFIFFLPLGLLIYLLIFHRRRQDISQGQPGSFGSIKSALVVFLISLAFYVPLAWTLRADPGLQQRVEQLSGPLDALLQGDTGPALSALGATLGVFSFNGDPRWTYSLPGRALFDPLASLFFYAGLGIVLWRWRRPKYALLIIWIGLALMPSALSADAPSTIRLIGLMPVAYLLLGIGMALLWSRWQEWVTRFRRRSALLLYLPWLLLALVLGVNLWRTVRDGFIQWPQATETRLKYQSVMQDMARYWEENDQPTLVVADSFFEPIDADSLRRNLGYDPGARWVQAGPAMAGAIVIPAESNQAQLYVPEFAPLAPELLLAAGISSTPSYRSAASPSFAVYVYGEQAPASTISAPVTLDEKITLLGYDLVEANEEQIRLLTTWRVEGGLPDNLAAFVHLVDAERTIIAQHDGLDAVPGLLRPGDIIIQYHILSVPNSLPAGPLTLLTGMYQRNSDRRLSRADTLADQITLLDRLFLTKE